MSYKVDCLKRVKNDWYHKWCCLLDYKLYDYVKGPLKFPMVTVAIPYTIKEKDQCNCTQHIKECYSKSGIPDPWDEYLIFRREMEKGNDMSNDFPKRDLDITRFLNQNYRIYLGQGIPDPWKKWMRIKPLEPSFDHLKKNWKNYMENLRNGPGYDMYDTEKVCCPNCHRQLLVLCLKKTNEDENRTEKEVVNVDPVSEPVDEKVEENKICLKDACVEADLLPDAKNVEVQVANTCSCEFEKICTCNNNCSSCLVCNSSKNGARTEELRFKGNDSCNCKRKPIKSGYFYNTGQNSPTTNKPVPQCIPLVEQNGRYCLPKIDYDHRGSILPFFYGSPDHCCFPQQFIGFEKKNNHNLELQLMCPRCEKKRKKRRKRESDGSGELRKDKNVPCRCIRNERDSFTKNANEGEYESEIYYNMCKIPSFKKEYIKSDGTPTFNRQKRCHCQEAIKTGIFKDKDYLHLLEILGCTDLFRDKLSRRFSLSQWQDALSDVTGERFYAHDKGWTDRNYKQCEICKHSIGRNKEFDVTEKNAKFVNKKQLPCRMTYNSHNTFDELRKYRLSRPRNRNLFKKELKYFQSNYSKNGLSNESESSSLTRAGKLKQ